MAVLLELMTHGAAASAGEVRDQSVLHYLQETKLADDEYALLLGVNYARELSLVLLCRQSFGLEEELASAQLEDNDRLEIAKNFLFFH